MRVSIWDGWTNRNIEMSSSIDPAMGEKHFLPQSYFRRSIPSAIHLSFRVDASGNIDVVWEGGFGGVSIWFSHSTDGGATFSPQASIAVLEAASVLSMALDSSGNISVVYNTVPFGNVFLARSTDGGASFTRTMVSRNNSRPFTNPRTRRSRSIPRVASMLSGTTVVEFSSADPLTKTPHFLHK
jgi:hypothetical protein